MSAHVTALVEAEPDLGDLTDVAPEASRWGGTALLFTGRWEPADAAVLLKVNVSAAQRFWAPQVADREPDLAPRVYARGDRLAGAEIGWLVMERAPSGLHAGWHGEEFTMLMDAGARFHKLARSINAPVPEIGPDDVLEWLEGAREHEAPAGTDSVLQRFAEDWRFVSGVCEFEIGHGDLHMANVLSRVPAPQPGPALLIDFEPCRLPWAFEAAYPQVLNSEPTRLGCRDLVPKMARLRQAYGMDVCAPAEIARLSAITLAWYALRMWWLLGPEPDPTWRATDVWRAETETYVRARARQ